MSSKVGFHEDLDRREAVKGSSERSFGIVFAVVFGLIAAWPLIGGNMPRWWAVGIAAAFLIVALARPRLLKWPNRLWFLFGQLLHRIVNPIVMGLLFFTTMVPIGLILKALGKDPLNRRFDPDAESYWIPRDPPGPAPGTMTRQF